MSFRLLLLAFVLALEIPSLCVAEDGIAIPSGVVSITEVGNTGRFLVANYSSISLFEPAARRFEPMRIVNNSRPNVPTGLAYDARRRRLFIANYLSNNVLIGRVDLNAREITIESEFGTDQATSPENVAVDTLSGDVAIANYDGNDVQIWTAEAESWHRTCTVPVAQAHGVAFVNGVVFATSLASREILKINSKACVIEARAGSAGWGDNQFLWPTAVGEFDRDHILVSDAHTGKLSVLAKQSLQFVKNMGGNGPNLFNMPYGFSRASDGSLLVLSTFGHEIVHFDSAGNLRRRYGSKNNVSWTDKDSLNRGNWKGYRRIDIPQSFLGRCVQQSYNVLYDCAKDRYFSLPEPDNTYLSGGSYFYFVQLSETDRGWVLSSPQNPNLIYLNKPDLRVVVLPLHVDVWQSAEAIVRGETTIPLGRVAQAASIVLEMEPKKPLTLEGAGEVIARQTAYAVNVLPSLWGVRSVHSTAEQVAMQLRKSLSELNEFVTATERCATAECNTRRLCEIADGAARQLVNRKRIPLDTLSAAAMLNPCFGPKMIAALSGGSISGE